MIDIEKYSVLLGVSDVKNMMNKTLCCECLATPECSYGLYGTGADSQVKIKCNCEGDFYYLNPELEHLRQGRARFFLIQ